MQGLFRVSHPRQQEHHLMDKIKFLTDSQGSLQIEVVGELEESQQFRWTVFCVQTKEGVMVFRNGFIVLLNNTIHVHPEKVRLVLQLRNDKIDWDPLLVFQ